MQDPIQLFCVFFIERYASSHLSDPAFLPPFPFVPVFLTAVSVFPNRDTVFSRDLSHWSLFPPTIPSSQYTAYRSDPAHPETVYIFLRSPLRMHTGENRSDCPVLSHQHESVVLNLHKHHFSFYLFYLRAWKCWEIKDLYLKLCTF